MSEAPEKPRVAADWFSISFQSFANALAAQYGCAVYLCGSALTKDQPGDYDVRVIVGEADMIRIFGKLDTKRADGDLWTQREWKIARERLKQSRRLSRAMRVNVDFQVQTIEESAKYEGQTRLRLDKAPEGFFRAGTGEP